MNKPKIRLKQTKQGHYKVQEKTLCVYHDQLTPIIPEGSYFHALSGKYCFAAPVEWQKNPKRMGMGWVDL